MVMIIVMVMIVMVMVVMVMIIVMVMIVIMIIVTVFLEVVGTEPVCAPAHILMGIPLPSLDTSAQFLMVSAFALHFYSKLMFESFVLKFVGTRVRAGVRNIHILGTSMRRVHRDTVIITTVNMIIHNVPH